MQDRRSAAAREHRGIIRSPQDAAGGLFLILIAAMALWQGAGLSAGTLNQIGPGMLPRVLAVLSGLCGLALLAGAFLAGGPQLGRWSLRGALFILGAAVLFGLAVRPLGLAVAGPLAMLVSAGASRETRWIEAVAYSAGITLFCIVLFKLLLGLPIPLAPWLIGY